MNRVTNLVAIGFLLLAGCGRSHAERTAEFVQNIRASPSVFIEAKFGERNYQGELTKGGIEKLNQVIASAVADHHPLTYSVQGSISYQSSDSKVLLLYISPRESGLRIDGNTYLRKIDPKDLEEICQAVSVTANNQ